MNINDLWIGDKVFIKNSKIEGRFEGVNAHGKARILINDKIFLVMQGDLELVPEKEYFPDIHQFIEEESVTPPKKLSIKINSVIDLHIDKLAPHMENEIPQRILEFQRQKCTEFVREAIEKHYPIVTIIHGIGQGVLKAEIEHLLQGFSQVRFSFSKNNGGAVEVWFD